jgi:hypothetical protein
VSKVLREACIWLFNFFVLCYWSYSLSSGGSGSSKSIFRQVSKKASMYDIHVHSFFASSIHSRNWACLFESFFSVGRIFCGKNIMASEPEGATFSLLVYPDCEKFLGIVVVVRS